MFGVRGKRRAGALEAARSSAEGSISESPSTSLDGKQAGFATTTNPENDDALAKWPYDWRKQWYAVGYDKDIVDGPKPFGVSIFDEPLVLYRDSSGALQCVSDLCPHRAAKLSEGMVTDAGKIECLYHGWQFDGSDGACTRIPQLPEGGSPPRAARLRVYPLAVSEGVVYVWMGDDPWGEGAKEILPVPSTVDKLDENKPTFTYEFVYDLPYDWSYLAENLLDPAHIPVSHDKTEGGGKKENAGEIKFDVVREGSDAPSPRGFSSLVRSNAFGKGKNLSGSRYTFEAPGVIRVRSDKKDGEPIFGAALHCIPIGQGRSRILFKTYAMSFPAFVRIMFALKPAVLRHLNSCKILEQDMKLICAQEDHVARTGQSLSEAFLPIKTADTLVVELRKWLDHVGHGMPHYVGWKTRKEPAILSDHEDSRRYNHRSNESRFHRHVLISAETRRALAKVKAVKRWGLAWAAVLAMSSVGLSCASITRLATVGADLAVSKLRAAGIAAACGAVVSLGLGVAAAVFEGHFSTNFERHPVLG